MEEPKHKIPACIICLLKPSLYFATFSYCPSSWTCHLSTTLSPSIRDSQTKKIAGYTVQALAVILGTMELYYRLISKDFRDVQTILSFLEFIVDFSAIGWVILVNFSWREKLVELKVMLRVFEYLKKGGQDEDEQFYKSRYNYCWVGIFWSVFSCATRFFSYASEEKGGMVYLNYVYSLLAEYLVSSFFIRILMDTSMYLGFYKKMVTQLDTLLKARFQNSEIISLSRLIGTESHFLDKMRHFRRFYLSILGSFRRSRLLLSSFMEFSTVVSYLQLTWILFLSIMSLSNIVVFDYKRQLTLVRILGKISFVFFWGYTCDQIEDSVTDMEKLLVCVPTSKLDKTDIRELEIFTKLLSWEKPMKGPKTNVSFGISFLSGLTVDIVVNAMVLIQLYFWFGK